MKLKITDDCALVIIDVQNDFCPGGALAVDKGDTVIPVINSISTKFRITAATQDWHPAGHISFASSHAGKDVYDIVPASYGDQVLWPDHCVAGTAGAEFHSDLVTDSCNIIIRKGTNSQIDSYSAFFENDRVTPTGLSGYLRACRVSTVVLCGLATDYCVYYTALDAVQLGFNTMVLPDAARGVNVPGGSVNSALEHMVKQGVQLVYT